MRLVDGMMEARSSLARENLMDDGGGVGDCGSGVKGMTAGPSNRWGWTPRNWFRRCCSCCVVRADPAMGAAGGGCGLEDGDRRRRCCCCCGGPGASAIGMSPPPSLAGLAGIRGMTAAMALSPSSPSLPLGAPSP